MNAKSLSALKSRTALYVAGALIVGALGAKMFWTEKPALRVPIATAKPAAKPTTKPSARTSAAKSAKNPEKSAEVRNDDRTAVKPPVAEPAPTPVAPAPAPARRVVPDDVDGSSDTEGLFLISTLKDGQGAEPVTQPTAAPAILSEAENNALAERVVKTGQRTGAATDGLGPMFVDETNGFCMRFPTGWSIRRFDGQPWVVECGDGSRALLNVGFSAFPSEYTAENIPLDWVARRTKKRSDTVLNAQGYATIMGKRALWSKSTGPMQVGTNQVKVVRTTYILPLGDGRVAEIRIAAAPEQFEKLSGVMKNSVSTFRLLGARSTDASIARTE